nr:hypothetical protein [Tanacetum cinerariifolium]
MINPSPPLHLVICSSESKPSILLETLGISSMPFMEVVAVGRGCFAVQRYGRRGGKKVYEFWSGKGLCGNNGCRPNQIEYTPILELNIVLDVLKGSYVNLRPFIRRIGALCLWGLVRMVMGSGVVAGNWQKKEEKGGVVFGREAGEQCLAQCFKKERTTGMV